MLGCLARVCRGGGLGTGWLGSSALPSWGPRAAEAAGPDGHIGAVSLPDPMDALRTALLRVRAREGLWAASSGWRFSLQSTGALKRGHNVSL